MSEKKSRPLFPFLYHIQGAECAEYLYDDDGNEIFDIERAKIIARKRFSSEAWEVHNGAKAYYDPKYDKEAEERRINA